MCYKHPAVHFIIIIILVILGNYTCIHKNILSQGQKES